MKVVALHTDFRIYWPARLKALSDYMQQRGDELIVIEIAGKGSPYSFAEGKTHDGLEWIVLFPESKPEELSGKLIWSVLRPLLDKINPDVIVSGAIAFPSGALAVRWTNSRRNKRAVVFDDAKINAVRRSPLVTFIKQSVYNGVDAMFYPSEKWIETGKYWGFEESRMGFGVDVVDNTFWSIPTSVNKTHIGSFFVAVGRQIPKKNFTGVLEAYKLYVDRVGRQKAMNLILVGNGPEHEHLLRIIKNYNLSDMVVCHDFKTQEELRCIYNEADALVVNSNEEETWGLVINEAMNCGCAIIASHETGATETLVEEGINGFITSCRDMESLTKAMYAYHQLSIEDKLKMSNASIETIKNWDLENFSSNLYKLIISILPPRNHTHNSHKRRPLSLLSRIIINLWSGQYRPT